MSAVYGLLTELKRRDIRVWLQDERVQYRAPKGRLDPELKEQMVALKGELESFLRLQQAEQGSVGVSARPREQSAYPLSFAQSRLWFLTRFEDQASCYNCPAVVPLPYAVDPAALQDAIDELVARHESLRTTFQLGAQGPEQVIHGEMPVALALHEPRGGRDGSEVQRLVNECALATFDLERGPLMRAALVRLGAEDHLLLLTLHHIVTDGWSMGILQRELTELYRARVESRAAQLPEAALQYLDYALWQREEVEGRIVPQQWPYWRERLAGCEAALALPTDRPRPTVKSTRGAVHRFVLPRELASGLQRVAAEHGVTLFMLTLAVFKMLLARLSGQDDIVVGTPVANRTRPEWAGVTGFFVNTVAIRSQAQREQTFAAYLQQVRSACLEAFDHQELPFELLVERLGLARDLSRNPLFQVMFALQNAGAAAQAAAAGTIQPELDFAKFDLNVSAVEVDGALAFDCEYATALWNAGSVAQLFDCYRALLQGVVADAGRPLGHYGLLSDEQWEQALERARGRRLEYERVVPMHRLIEAQAAAQPHAPAVHTADVTFDYGELNRRANRLAALLRARGLRPGQICALCMERSAQLPVAMLAILKAGGAYLPLDPELPPNRLAFMLRDAGAVLLLADPALATRFDAGELQVLVCDENLTQGYEAHEANCDLADECDAPAYVLYTSGSTGAPKAVVNHHRGLHNRLAWMQHEHPIGPGDRVLQKTNYAFDVSVWEFIWPLLQGATLVLAAPGGHRDPAYLARLIAEQNITVLHFVPSMLQLFLPVARAEQLGSLRAVFCSGEALPWEAVERFRTLGLKARLVNLYGPTEAAIDVSVWDCAREPARPGMVPIGLPIDNIELYVLDPQLRLLPPGVPGEIYIGGVGLATGYLNRPELTAERFVPDPFGAPGARLYRTGDLGRVLPDGSLEYLGRIDFQVKLRGLRIELEEVEHHLLAQPGVEQAAVVLARSPAGEPTLAGYYKASAEAPSEEQLKAALRAHLPEHEVPSRVIALEELPLNANGKLDRKVLAARPLAPLAAAADAGEGPGSELESTIARVWAELLGVERVQTTQNFFDLSGNSLLMVRVQQALTPVLGREVPLVKLFAHPSVRALARFLESTDEPSPAEPQALAQMLEGNQRLAQLRARRAAMTEA